MKKRCYTLVATGLIMATLCMGGLAIGLAAPADSVANQAAQTALAVDNESIAITVAGKPT